MGAEIDSEVMFSVGTAQTRAAEKVHPATPAKPLQELPVEGKELPPNSQKAEDIDEAVDEAVRIINEHFKASNSELRFSVDEDSGRTVIKVIDKETEDTIRQIPSDEVLKFARMLEEGADLELIDTYI